MALWGQPVLREPTDPQAQPVPLDPQALTALPAPLALPEPLALPALQVPPALQVIQILPVVVARSK